MSGEDLRGFSIISCIEQFERRRLTIAAKKPTLQTNTILTPLVRKRKRRH